MPPFDDNLPAYADLQQSWSGILIGNGASRAVSDRFAYSSLYDTACSTVIAHPLAQPEQDIFSFLGTRNFEQVLSALTTARVVNKAFGYTCDELEASYERIRSALVEAVHSVHVPHADVPVDSLLAIRTALLSYDFVYSTNYDLLIYWALMQGPAEFRDYFFSGPIFDIGDTEVWQKSTKVLFLHGGLHLYRTRIGQTLKRTAGAFGNLLDDFATPIGDQDGAVPLFITEGSYADKLRSLYTSDYLSFGYSQLSRHQGPLVIFGHALDEQFDKHLVMALHSSPIRVLGIGIHPQSAGGKSVSQLKAEWTAKFHNYSIHFFDASTHPLGLPELKMP